MKKLTVLVVAALLAMMIFAPAGMAQETTMMMEETTMMENTMMMEDTGGDLPGSGGPSLLLPAAALLLGSGVLAFAVLRRR